MEISFGETRVFCFPMFDFNGIPSGALSLSGVSNTAAQTGTYTEFQQGGTLKMGMEGYWKVWGISGSTFETEAGGLASQTNINIQIFETEGKGWFNLDNQNTERVTAVNLGAPIEAVCGKWGNPKLLKHPRILAPGQEIYLKAAQYSGSKPTGRSPMYVVLFCELMGGPEMQHPRGLASWIPQHYPFSAIATVINAGASVVKETQLGSPHDYLITSMMAKSNTFIATGNYFVENDPRTNESEMLISVRGSSMQNDFFQGQPPPIALVSGLWGARNIPLPSFYRLKKGDSLIVKIYNNTPTSIQNDLDLTFTGLLEGAKQ